MSAPYTSVAGTQSRARHLVNVQTTVIGFIYVQLLGYKIGGDVCWRAG